MNEIVGAASAADVLLCAISAVSGCASQHIFAEIGAYLAPDDAPALRA